MEGDYERHGGRAVGEKEKTATTTTAASGTKGNHEQAGAE